MPRWRLRRQDRGGAPPESEEARPAATLEADRGLVAKAILVPVDGSDASLEAVALACSLARRQKGRVYAVHVIEVPRSLAIDAQLDEESIRGEAVLQRAEEAARNADYDVEAQMLQARDVGQAVVDEAVSLGVELIIMGMDYKEPMGQFKVGHLTEYVLKNAPIEVWAIRRPPAGEGGS